MFQFSRREGWTPVSADLAEPYPQGHTLKSAPERPIMCVRTRRRVSVDALTSKTREERGAMAVISTSQQADGLARPNDWQAPLSAASFQPAPKYNRSKG